MSASSWTPPAVGTPVWIEIPVTDMGRAKKFYGQVFGWTFDDADETRATPEDYQIFNKKAPLHGGLKRVDTIPSLGGNTDASTKLYLYVTDIDETLESVKKHGGSVVSGKKPEGESAYDAVFKDSEGNVQAVWQLKA